jgi:hypothetical protein
MKTRTRGLAKPGIFGTKDNPQVVTEDDLRQISRSFPAIKKAPVSLNGHSPDPSAPRLGNVVSVEWDESSKTLIGTIEEHDALSDAVDQGFYPDVSIGAKRRASDGALYLHHLAYLGEEPPAIKDLVAGVASSLETNIAASDSEADFIIPPIKTRIELSDQTNSKQNASVAGERENKKEKIVTLEEAISVLESERTKTASLSDRLTAAQGELEKYKTKVEEMAQKYPEEISLSDAEPMVKTLTAQLRKEKTAGVLAAAAGKVPKAKIPLLEALAQALPLGQSIELSDSAGKLEKVSPLELLSGILSAIPSPVETGKLDLSDASEEEKPVDLTGIMRRI